jgi:outer membrane lipoprotein-sorting protein
MNKKRAFYYCLLIVLASISFSCTSSRKAIRHPLKEEGADYLFDNLKKHELKFDSFSAKFSAVIENNKKETSFDGLVRIQRDSIIWISVTPLLGIEMARFMLTNDSIKYLNRINATYLQKDFSYINEMLNKTIDFDMAQAFLTGNDFSFYENSRFKAQVDGQEYKLHTVNRLKLKRTVRKNDPEISIPIQSIWLNPDNFKISKVILNETDKDNRRFTAFYKEFETIDNQMVPSKIEYRVETNKDNVRIRINYSRITINPDQLSFPFKVPEHYTEIQDWNQKPAEKE